MKKILLNLLMVPTTFSASRAAIPALARQRLDKAHRPARTVISETACDIDGDGVAERIQIVLVSGKRYVDNPYCGGGEKWEGQFVVRVRTRTGRLRRETPLNRLFDPGVDKPMSLFFWTPKFRLVVHDYNHDGRMDFNLGQYGVCIGNRYRLFTITRQGAVSALSIDPKHTDEGQPEWFVSPGMMGAPGTHHDNSTPAIQRRGKWTIFSWWDRETRGSVVEKWKWEHGRFEWVSSEEVDFLN